MTSTNSWKNILAQRRAKAGKVALVGVGHELRGDDAAGVLVARALRPSQNDHCLIIEAGHAPENVTGLLRRFAPEWVLFIDAAQMNEAPGTVRWLDWREITGVGGSTHSLPLSALAQYLTQELGCEVALLGIQPAQNELDAPLSPGVAAAVHDLTQELSAWFASV